MAIVEMKHVNLLALEQDKQALLCAIQKLGCFQITPADSESAAFSRPQPTDELPLLEETLARVSWAIGRLNPYDPVKKPFMSDKPSIDEAQAKAIAEKQPELMRTVERLEAMEREAGELRGQHTRIETAKEQLEPWNSLKIPPAELQSTRNTVAMLGTIRKDAYDQWFAEDKQNALCMIELVSTRRDLAYIYVLMHCACREEALRRLKDANFTQIHLQCGSGTVEAQLALLEAEKQETITKQQTIREETAALAIGLDELKQLHDVLSSRKERLLAAKQFSLSERTFFLQGWAPAPMIETIQTRLKRVSPSVSLEFTDALEGEEPPVLLHNAKAFTPFESIVSGFSLPSPYGIDPTAIMTPFYINFMGMMVSDAGYGLMMAILIPILIKLLKPSPGAKRLMWIIAAGGVMTVFWGALYNTWFGFAPFPSVFDPVNNALPVMGVCIGLGAIHLFTGLGVAAYMNIKRGKPLAAIADQLSWFLLIVGLGLLIVAPAVGKWVALTGAFIILVTTGREKSKNPFKRLLSGLGALYGITSWVSDLLSYIRLFGMGLATGVIGMVVNILVGMVFSSGIIGVLLGSLLFVGGHLFNAGINILGAYVHSCRLQYIEFFGKFYEDGGKPFTPLTETGRYVYIQEALTRP